MEPGAKVTAEILSNGKPEKINGTILEQYNDGGLMYEIRPDGFVSMTINVPARYVYRRIPTEITKPRLEYNNKKR